MLRCARGGARPRPQCELRALERMFAPPRACTRMEGQGGDPREPRPAAPLRVHELSAAARDPPQDVRPGSSRCHPADLPPRPLRARRVAVRVLRFWWKSADARPRRPEVAWRHFRLGERGHLLRSVQPSQGRSPARGDEHDPPHHSTAADARALHPPCGGARPGRLAAIPARSRSRGCSRVVLTWTSRARRPPALRARAQPRTARDRGP